MSRPVQDKARRGAQRGSRITTRRGAIAAIVGLQAAVLAAGWALTFMQVRHATALAVQDLVLDENVRVAHWFADQLTAGIETPLVYGSPDWERAQQRVEGLRLPGDGFVCLLDRDGRVLCHPDLRSDASLRDDLMGNLSVSPADSGENLMLGQAPQAETLAGRLRFSFDETHFIATLFVPELGARLVVHQPESGLVAMSARAVAVMAIITISAAMSVLALTALATLWVMRRYDTTLEQVNRGLEEEVERRTHQNMRARDALIMGLAKLADCRDNETGLHLERIAEYCGLLAHKLAETHPEMDEAWIERLRLASSMHDIGKVGLPDEILLKPGKLTPGEFERMKAHTTIGADTLLMIRTRLGDDDLLDMAIQIALEHHERWDGTGYPVGLAGEQIALPARIVALADVYDALTSRRVYKAAMSHEEARRIILEGCGSHFDPTLVDAFLAIQSAFDDIRARLHPGVAIPLVRAA